MNLSEDDDEFFAEPEGSWKPFPWLLLFLALIPLAVILYLAFKS